MKKLFLLIAFSLLLPSLSFADNFANVVLTSGNNSAGLTTTVDCGSYAYVQVTAIAGASATVNLQTSADNVSFDTVQTLLSAASGTAIGIYELGERYVSLTSATTGVALTFKIRCKGGKP